MRRKFPLGEYPPTGQELVILKLLRSRPHWDINELLSELSKGRNQPMTYSSLTVHMCNLRRKGFLIERRTVYSICRPTQAAIADKDKEDVGALALADPLLNSTTTDPDKQALQDSWTRLLDAAMSFDRELARALEERT